MCSIFGHDEIKQRCCGEEDLHLLLPSSTVSKARLRGGSTYSNRQMLDQLDQRSPDHPRRSSCWAQRGRLRGNSCPDLFSHEMLWRHNPTHCHVWWQVLPQGKHTSPSASNYPFSCVSPSILRKHLFAISVFFTAWRLQLIQQCFLSSNSILDCSYQHCHSFLAI